MIILIFFFFNYTAPTEIYTRPYTLSLHDALPIWRPETGNDHRPGTQGTGLSTRSEEHTSELQSHGLISYAVFCLKKKNNRNVEIPSLSDDGEITLRDWYVVAGGESVYIAQHPGDPSIVFAGFFF